MAVVLETTLGDITIDLFLKERPRACLNFLKLCKMKYFNYNLFHTISRGFIAQTGDPTGSRNGGESIFGVIEGPLKRYFEAERNPRMKHTTLGLVSFVGTDDQMIGSQFFITLGSDLTYLDEQHCIFGEVMEGLDVLEILNETICDQDNRPYQDVRITHTVVLEDPFPDPEHLHVPSRSPSPNAERLQGGRIAPDEEIDETHGKSLEEVNEIIAAKEAKARATILEMIGDIPDAEMAPPENVLFVCKLNPVTTDDDLEIIFSRFGKIKSCEVIRDKKSGESLQYAFVEFDDRKPCEDAYFKMDNVLIDDRRIHVDFSQSVAKVKWHGKGRGVTTYDDDGKKSTDRRNDLGNGRYYRKKLSSTNEETRHYDTPDRRIKRESGGRTDERNFERRYERQSFRNEPKRRDNYRDNRRDGRYYREERYYENRTSRNYRSDRRLDEKENGERKYQRSRSRSRDRLKTDRKKEDRRSRSRSRSRTDRKKEQDDRNKYVKKGYKEDRGDSPGGSAKKAKFKDSLQKLKQKKHHSTSDEDTSTEENSSSSENSSGEERKKRKKKHKKKYSSTSSDEHKKIKKKNKSKKKRCSSSDEES